MHKQMAAEDLAEPPCPTCEWGSVAAPELMEANEDAWELWQAVKTQWIAGPNGIIGLNYPAVFEVGQRLEIDVDRIMLSKLQMLESAVLSAMEKKRKKDREKRR